MEPGDMLPKVAHVVPESFVDLIRRVTPGATILVVFSVLTGLPRGFAIGGIGAGALIVFLLLSYATGLSVDALADWGSRWLFTWYAWRDFVKPRNQEEIDGIGRLLNLKPDKVGRLVLSKCDQWQVPGLLSAKIRATNPIAALVQPKLVAEEFLLKNLATGLLLVGVISGFLYWLGIPLRVVSAVPRTLSSFLALSLLGLVAEAVLIVGAFQRARRVATRTREWARPLWVRGNDQSRDI